MTARDEESFQKQTTISAPDYTQTNNKSAPGEINNFTIITI